MKKAIVTLLITFTAILHIGCGENNSQLPTANANSTVVEEPTIDTTTHVESSEKENENIIQISPIYVPVDDDNVKIEITSVSKEIYNEGNKKAESVHYTVNYTVTNKSEEHDVAVSVTFGSCSVGKYMVEFGSVNSDTKAGKINDSACFMCIASDESGGLISDGSEHIESLEDLLQFEAEIDINIYDYDGHSRNSIERYTVPVSLINR